MAQLGEAAQGYKVYQQNQTKKNQKPVPVTTGVLKGVGYNEGGAVAAGQANKDMLYAGQARAQQDDYNMRQQLGLLPGQAPASHPTYGGSGGGSGGAHVPVPAYDAAQLDALMAMVDQAGQADRASAQGSYAGLDRHLAALTDPYAHIQPAAAAQVDPSQLAALLQSQTGGDGAGLRAQAQYLQATNGSDAAASDRLAQMLSANQQSWNQGTRSAGQLAAKQTDGDLLSQLLAMQAAIQAKKTVMK